jgi:hypothetical protein
MSHTNTGRVEEVVGVEPTGNLSQLVADLSSTQKMNRALAGVIQGMVGGTLSYAGGTAIAVTAGKIIKSAKLQASHGTVMADGVSRDYPLYVNDGTVKSVDASQADKELAEIEAARAALAVREAAIRNGNK